MSNLYGWVKGSLFSNNKGSDNSMSITESSYSLSEVKGIKEGVSSVLLGVSVEWSKDEEKLIEEFCDGRYSLRNLAELYIGCWRWWEKKYNSLDILRGYLRIVNKNLCDENTKLKEQLETSKKRRVSEVKKGTKVKKTATGDKKHAKSVVMKPQEEVPSVPETVKNENTISETKGEGAEPVEKNEEEVPIQTVDRDEKLQNMLL